jgi:hypothetical protein
VSGEPKALCLAGGGGWDGVANRIGGRLVNRETSPGADPVTFLLIPATGDPEAGAPMTTAAREAYRDAVCVDREGGKITTQELDGVMRAIAAAQPWIRADEQPGSAGNSAKEPLPR